MTVDNPKQIEYDHKVLHRGLVAFACTPFQWSLLAVMEDRSVSLVEVLDLMGLETGFTDKALSELTAEHYMMWLIRVGILRREVDGQGLTNGFRLTPLGWKLAKLWEEQEIPDSISITSRLWNNFQCWCSRFAL